MIKYNMILIFRVSLYCDSIKIGVQKENVSLYKKGEPNKVILSLRLWIEVTCNCK